MARTTILEAAPRAVGATSYADLVVLLDGTPEDENRIAHAETLATLHGTRIVGALTNVRPETVVYATEIGAAAIAELADAVKREGDLAEQRLFKRFRRLGVENELRRIEDFVAFLPSLIATEARTADLLIASLPYGEDSTRRWRPTIERVLFEGGRAIYLVPPGQAPRASLRTALVGWTNTRESARAVAEALPLLRTMGKVEITTIREPMKNRLGGADCLADIGAHLARCGVMAEVGVLPDRGDAAAMLMAEARRIAADVLVIGGFGHSRVREWALGGVTAHVFEQATLPVLLAH